MADISAEFEEAGAEIIWVLEEDRDSQPGTVGGCMEVMDVLGSPSVGWCVGDGQTEPEAGVFDDAEVSIYQGFDMIVERRTMRIAFARSHGDSSAPFSAGELLGAVRGVVAGLGSGRR